MACDVTTTFTDAAAVFGPQKGASPAEVKMLTRRLERLAQMFRDEFGADVTSIVGGGAAGGLGGALAALGGRLVPGFELVADELDLYDHLDGADLVITGEGRLDATSFAGKVVGGVAALAAEAGIRAVGDRRIGRPGTCRRTMLDATPASITRRERFGERSGRLDATKQCIEQTAAAAARRRSSRHGEPEGRR